MPIGKLTGKIIPCNLHICLYSEETKTYVVTVQVSQNMYYILGELSKEEINDIQKYSRIKENEDA